MFSGQIVNYKANAHQKEPKALYTKKDNRLNYYEMDKNLSGNFCSQAKANAAAVGCLIDEKYLFSIEDSDEIILANSLQTLNKCIKNLYNGASLSKREKFRKEISAGEGTAFIVGRKLALTAGHCILEESKGKYVLNNDRVKNLRLVLGFNMTDDNQCTTTFEKKNVFSIKYVKDYVHNSVEDWALLKLNESTDHIRKLKLNFNSPIEGSNVYIEGHPCGLPFKIAVSGTINKIYNHHFLADVNSFSGNSGSPIINKVTHQVEGILVRGNEDFEIVNEDGKSKVISKHNKDDAGEDCCLIRKKMFETVERRYKHDIKKRQFLSDQNSNNFLLSERRDFKKIQSDQKCNIVTGISMWMFGALVFPIGTPLIISGVKLEEKADDAINRGAVRLNDILNGPQKISNVLNCQLNHLEADLISQYIPKTVTTEDQRRLPSIARNMSAYQISYDEAEEIYNIRESFPQFSHKQIANVLGYEKQIGKSFSNEERKIILKYLNRVDPETQPKFFSIEKAFVRGIAKYEQEKGERVYSKEAFIVISRYYFFHIDTITFDDACKEFDELRKKGYHEKEVLIILNHYLAHTGKITLNEACDEIST